MARGMSDSDILAAAKGPRGMEVADAETGEFVVLNTRTAFEEEDEEEVARVTEAAGGGGKKRRHMAAKRVERGLPPITQPLGPLVGLSPAQAAELQVYRAKLDKEILDIIEREERREEVRQQLLRDEPAAWKRKKMEAAFRKERKQARRDLETLRYDNELSLAHKLASLGLLK